MSADMTTPGELSHNSTTCEGRDETGVSDQNYTPETLFPEIGPRVVQRRCDGDLHDKGKEIHATDTDEPGTAKVADGMSDTVKCISDKDSVENVTSVVDCGDEGQSCVGDKVEHSVRSNPSEDVTNDKHQQDSETSDIITNCDNKQTGDEEKVIVGGCDVDDQCDKIFNIEKEDARQTGVNCETAENNASNNQPEENGSVGSNLKTKKPYEKLGCHNKQVEVNDTSDATGDNSSAVIHSREAVMIPDNNKLHTGGSSTGEDLEADEGHKAKPGQRDEGSEHPTDNKQSKQPERKIDIGYNTNDDGSICDKQDMGVAETGQVNKPHAEQTGEPHTEQTSEHHLEQTGEHRSEKTSEHHTEETGEHHTEETSEHHTEETSEHHSEETSEHHSEKTSEHHTEETSEHHTEETGEHHTEETSEHHTEETSEHHIEQTGEHHTKLTIELHTEGISKPHTEQTSEHHTEETSEHHTEQTSEHHLDQTGEHHLEQAGEHHLEQTSEHHTDETGEPEDKETDKPEARDTDDKNETGRIAGDRKDKEMSRDVGSSKSKSGIVNKHRMDEKDKIKSGVVISACSQTRPSLAKSVQSCRGNDGKGQFLNKNKSRKTEDDEKIEDRYGGTNKFKGKKNKKEKRGRQDVCQAGTHKKQAVDSKHRCEPQRERMADQSEQQSNKQHENSQSMAERENSGRLGQCKNHQGKTRQTVQDESLSHCAVERQQSEGTVGTDVCLEATSSNQPPTYSGLKLSGENQTRKDIHDTTGRNFASEVCVATKVSSEINRKQQGNGFEKVRNLDGHEREPWGISSQQVSSVDKPSKQHPAVATGGRKQNEFSKQCGRPQKPREPTYNDDMRPESKRPKYESGSTWLHLPENCRKFAGKNDVLSNFYSCDLYVYEMEFWSTEQAYQWRKAMFMGNKKAAEDIYNAKYASQAKSIANQFFRGVDMSKWITQRVPVMRQLLRAKARCCKKFADELRSTGDKLIVENVPADQYWAIGDGNGKNVMGRLLMELRDKLDEALQADENEDGKMVEFPIENTSDPFSTEEEHMTKVLLIGNEQVKDINCDDLLHDFHIDKVIVSSIDEAQRHVNDTNIFQYAAVVLHLFSYNMVTKNEPTELVNAVYKLTQTITNKMNRPEVRISLAIYPLKQRCDIYKTRADQLNKLLRKDFDGVVSCRTNGFSMYNIFQDDGTLSEEATRQLKDNLKDIIKYSRLKKGQANRETHSQRQYSSRK